MPSQMTCPTSIAGDGVTEPAGVLVLVGVSVSVIASSTDCRVWSPLLCDTGTLSGSRRVRPLDARTSCESRAIPTSSANETTMYRQYFRTTLEGIASSVQAWSNVIQASRYYNSRYETQKEPFRLHNYLYK